MSFFERHTRPKEEPPPPSPIPYARFMSLLGWASLASLSNSQFWERLAGGCEVFSLTPSSKIEGGSYEDASEWVEALLDAVLEKLPDQKAWSGDRESDAYREYKLSKSAFQDFIVCLRLLLTSVDSAEKITNAVRLKKYPPKWMGSYCQVLVQHKFDACLLLSRDSSVIVRKAEFKEGFWDMDRLRGAKSEKARLYQGRIGMRVNYAGHEFVAEGAPYAIDGAPDKEALLRVFNHSVVILNRKEQATRMVVRVGRFETPFYLLQHAGRYQKMRMVSTLETPKGDL